MKILHINYHDKSGGAGIAALRLHRAMLKHNIDSNFLVLKKSTNLPKVFTANNSNFFSFFIFPLKTFLEQIYLAVFHSKGIHRKFNRANFGTDITHLQIFKEADIINLHWVTQGFISLKVIKKIIASNKKVFWTLHDMWSFTGGCYYNLGCENYKTGCGKCPLLKSDRLNDVSKRLANQKTQILKSDNIKFITCSNWLKNEANSSYTAKNVNVSAIHNTLDQDLFKPIDKFIAKSILNIPTDTNYILFGAINAQSDLRKGYKHFKDIVQIFIDKDLHIQHKLSLLIFGSYYDEELDKLPINCQFLGILSDEYSLNLAYNASSVFVTTSIQDNLPNTLVESTSCGTPSVAFNTGGISDIILHKKNGYLAELNNSNDIIEGIIWCVESNKKGVLTTNARNIALDKFSNSKIVEQYLNTYNNL